jgi:transposase
VQALESHNGHHRAIREVSMDMSPSYIAGVQENIGNQAVVVFDKFHVIAHVNDAVNAVRRPEIQMGGWEAKNALKGSWWIWLKNPENLTDKQRTTQQRIATVNLATGFSCPQEVPSRMPSAVPGLIGLLLGLHGGCPRRSRFA